MAPKKALREATVEFCMSKALAYVTPDSNVDDAAAVMKERDIRSVLVTENGAYVGILTETDLLFEVLIGGNDPKSTKVSSIMTPPWNPAVRKTLGNRTAYPRWKPRGGM